MTPPLPDGARLALLHWPWGTPTVDGICRAATDNGFYCSDPAGLIFMPLIETALIVDVPDVPQGQLRRFRLTPAGRRALDEIQSGEAGR